MVEILFAMPYRHQIDINGLKPRRIPRLAYRPPASARRGGFHEAVLVGGGGGGGGGQEGTNGFVIIAST